MLFSEHLSLTRPRAIESAMREAIDIAQEHRGATSPNPPVGAVALDKDGKRLGSAAHERAGLLHAEAKLIETLRTQNLLSRATTLVVTLEPCNHQGRTGPCVEAIAQSSIKEVIFGTLDPNPNVEGHGARALNQKGITTSVFQGTLGEECQNLIRPFRKWITTQNPWITIKTAHLADGSMIPPPGKKTFCNTDSLRAAHLLRKRADAIVTGSGTVLMDQPDLTVRLVPDHAEKKRFLVLADRRKRIPQEYIERKIQQGFTIILSENLRETFADLGRQNVLEVLVEAGPTLSESLLHEGLWDEHWIFRHFGENEKDQREIRYR